MIGIDGFSGAGKTTLAEELRDADPALSVLLLEDFYLGWDGLAAGPRRAFSQVVEPLTRGGVPRVEPWDWRRDRVAPPHPEPVADLTVIEGCGAGARPLRAAYALLIWVDADPAERERRLHARDDWADYAPRRASFERQEQALAAAEGTRAAADVVLGWAAGGRVVARRSRALGSLRTAARAPGRRRDVLAQEAAGRADPRLPARRVTTLGLLVDHPAIVLTGRAAGHPCGAIRRDYRPSRNL